MADSKVSPNRLRPYYIPPSIGKESQSIPSANATISPKPSSTASPSFSFSDLDYSDYIPDASPSIAGTVKIGLENALWKYFNVSMAQPFEVAKLILQVRVAQETDGDIGIPQTPSARPRDFGGEQDEDEDQDGREEQLDSDDEEPNYFTTSTHFAQSSSAAANRIPPRGRSGRPAQSSRQNSRNSANTVSQGLSLKNPASLMEALSSLSASHGSLSIWKATNTTFVYSFLHRTLETFLRSFLAAIFGIAESDILLTTSSSLPDNSILNSPAPTATVLIATAAATLASLVLAPIDTARTLQILLPSSAPNRNLLSTLRTLSPSWLIPSHLIPITFLSSSLPTLISTSTPLFLKSNLNLDPAIHPTSWSLLTFLASAFDLSLKFPLETVLRRAQIATWTSPELALTCTTKKSAKKPIETVVPVPSKYPGVLPTIWSIMREEGYSESQKDRTATLMGKAPRRRRKGQGIEGLYRGWRVGLWGLVGVWGTAFVGGLQGDVAIGGTPSAGKF